MEDSCQPTERDQSFGRHNAKKAQDSHPLEWVGLVNVMGHHIVIVMWQKGFADVIKPAVYHTEALLDMMSCFPLAAFRILSVFNFQLFNYDVSRRGAF